MAGISWGNTIFIASLSIKELPLKNVVSGSIKSTLIRADYLNREAREDHKENDCHEVHEKIFFAVFAVLAVQC
jgi:hypothetical protein